MLILPVLTFAVPAWCYILKSVLKHLQIVQNMALRNIHSDWYTRNIQIHEDLQMEYLKVISTKLVKKSTEKSTIAIFHLLEDLANTILLLSSYIELQNHLLSNTVFWEPQCPDVVTRGHINLKQHLSFDTLSTLWWIW